MTVLLTGGSGLVGSHVIEALRACGHPVRALVRPAAVPTVRALGAEPVTGDVTDRTAWARAAVGISGIVHAAAFVARRTSLDAFRAVNVGGTERAIETARTAGVPLVHVSSVAVYGRDAAFAEGPQCVTEDYTFRPLPDWDYYARSKREAELAVQLAARTGGVAAVAIRPNVIYGERDRLFAPRVVRFVRHGMVPQVGSGQNHLSCVYAGNVAAAVVTALERVREGFRAYNTTNDSDLTQREFFETFAQAAGKSVRWIPVPTPLVRAGIALYATWQSVTSPGVYPGVGRAAVGFLTGENPYSSERARAELDWRPRVPPREAIARTVRWVTRGREKGDEKPG